MTKQNPQRRWPTADILTRAVFTDDAGPIRFVDTEAAARYLTLEAHTLECYRTATGQPSTNSADMCGTPCLISMLGPSTAARNRRERRTDGSESEMGRTLQQFIASLPKDQQEQIETRYEALRRDYLEASVRAPDEQTQAEEAQDALKNLPD